MLSLVLSGPALALSCGGDSKEEKAPPPAAGGAPQEAEPKECGAETCQPVELIAGLDPIQACCPAEGGCGLDSSFLAEYGNVGFTEVCQPLHQPGEKTTDCPDSPRLTVPNTTTTLPPFVGCCRQDTKTCGYLLDKLLSVITVGLGCVDSGPFLDGGTAEPCTPANEGAAGNGN